MLTAKRSIADAIQWNLPTCILPWTGLVQQYALPSDQGSFPHMELMNQFLELMSNPMFLHETVGYWLMRIDTWSNPDIRWGQETIDRNSRMLYSLSICETPFLLIRAVRLCRAKTSLGHFIDDQANLSVFSPTIEPDSRYEEDLDLVSSDGWWPFLRIVNKPSS